MRASPNHCFDRQTCHEPCDRLILPVRSGEIFHLHAGRFAGEGGSSWAEEQWVGAAAEGSTQIVGPCYNGHHYRLPPGSYYDRPRMALRSSGDFSSATIPPKTANRKTADGCRPNAGNVHWQRQRGETALCCRSAVVPGAASPPAGSHPSGTAAIRHLSPPPSVCSCRALRRAKPLREF